MNGCFWHRHPNCKYASIPKTRPEFWSQKFKSNVERDNNNYIKIKNLGWKYIVVWECELKNRSDLVEKLKFSLD